ncbi:GNAT family N-acetyltransferase, partial [Xylella fastidiosa subsp. multiplex]|uniref:GNAT family N-acetyltransferase n=1 Tax=Xylella fastidiosa TaxID=2371 RepID=UPI001322BD17
QVGLPEIVSFTVADNARSRAMMRRLGMREDPQRFDHPAVPDGHPLKAHVLYRLDRGTWLAGKNGDADNGVAPVAAA